MSENGYIFIVAWALAAAWTLRSGARHGLPPSVSAICALGIPLILALLAALPWWAILALMLALFLSTAMLPKAQPQPRKAPAAPPAHRRRTSR